MQIRKHTDNTQFSPDGRFRNLITVFHFVDVDGQARPVQISWVAGSGISAGEARQFLECLQAAIALAGELNHDNGTTN